VDKSEGGEYLKGKIIPLDHNPKCR